VVSLARADGHQTPCRAVNIERANREKSTPVGDGLTPAGGGSGPVGEDAVSFGRRPGRSTLAAEGGFVPEPQRIGGKAVAGQRLREVESLTLQDISSI